MPANADSDLWAYIQSEVSCITTGSGRVALPTRQIQGRRRVSVRDAWEYCVLTQVHVAGFRPQQKSSDCSHCATR